MGTRNRNQTILSDENVQLDKDDDEYSIIEKHFNENMKSQSKKLLDAGLSVDPPTPNEKYIQQFENITKAEDL